MECWVKTSGAAAGANTGARIGLDYYGTPNGVWTRICGINSPLEAAAGEGWPNWNGGDDSAYFVPWGSGWTLIYWSFTVPSKAMGDGGTGQACTPLGQWCAIDYCVPWCQIYGQNGYLNTYTSWFSDFQFYISP
jgi:hypothetical protein